MSLSRNSLKALGIESEKIDAIIDGHVETVNGLKTKAEELQAELDKTKDAIGERDRFKSELEKANERISTLESQSANSDGIISERDQFKTEADTLRAQVEALTAERDASNTELTSLREKVATFDTEKATLTENATRIQNEFDTYKAQIDTEKANDAKKGSLRDVLRNNGVARQEFQDLIINATNLADITIGDNGIENVDAFIESTKAKYPACFSSIQEGGTPPINPPGGAPSRPFKLEDLKHMTPDEINAKWRSGDVQEALKKQSGQ